MIQLTLHTALLAILVLMSMVPMASEGLPIQMDGAQQAAEVPDREDAVPPWLIARPDSDFVDFNGDGFGDLAIGAPRDTISTSDGQMSGEVNVLYGHAHGLRIRRAQLWDRAALGLVDQGVEHFGRALAAADFNGDGYTDLAIGAPGALTSEEAPDAGEVHVLYGSTVGLTAAGNQTFSQATPAIVGVAEEGDGFGRILTSGDYNGDGYADLVVGVPFEGFEAGGLPDMGAVNVIYGSEVGLTTAGNQIIHPALPAVSGSPSDDGLFGYGLATGDFDNDGYDDLGVGTPNYELAGGDEVGAVTVFYGSGAGVSLAGEQQWRQGFGGVQGDPEDDDAFGAVLAAGDFDNNGADDLVIAAPGEDIEVGSDTWYNAGAIHLLFGYQLTDGLSGSGDLIWHRNVPGIDGSLNNELFFGASLVAADFDNNGYDDLAVGVSGDSPLALEQGVIQTFRFSGAFNGDPLSLVDQDLWYQGIMPGKAEVGDFLGLALGTADFDGDGYADLAAGAPFEDLRIGGSTQPNAGAVNVLYGSGDGLTRAGLQFWHQRRLPGTIADEDQFGWALSR